MTATMPALAVTTLLHDRATASARLPTRTGPAEVRTGFVPRPLTFKTARFVVGSQPASSASRTVPSPRRTFRPSTLRPSAPTVVTTTSSAYTRPLAGTRAPSTPTTASAPAATDAPRWESRQRTTT